ncbi:MAG: hypothetical protein P1U70_06390 [Saprospiraceae bacterium]|jgi:hypothetical protein|nr:hypothetical protein [Saprospiraceae bacterium]
MNLILKGNLFAEDELIQDDIRIQDGAGVYMVSGGIGNTQNAIKVFYYKPKNYSPESRILMVIPEAGRNGDSYRDAWIEEAKKYSVLIISPMYPEDVYGFEKYHLCGLISNLNLRESIEYVKGTNIAKMDEEKFSFDINANSSEWIFNDFDRLFDLTVQSLNSTQTKYDLFGHSAGGQILHRLAIFHPNNIWPVILVFIPYRIPPKQCPLG